MANQISTPRSGENPLSLREKIRDSQLKAALAVNAEMIRLYWWIGREILAHEEHDGRSEAYMNRLSQELREKFADKQTFSHRNLMLMRDFAEAWPKETLLTAQLVHLTWNHHLVLLEKGKGAAQRLWYAEQTIEHGWSSDDLAKHIDKGLYRRSRRGTMGS